jgi:hypothetical protein
MFEPIFDYATKSNAGIRSHTGRGENLHAKIGANNFTG